MREKHFRHALLTCVAAALLAAPMAFNACSGGSKTPDNPANTSLRMVKAVAGDGEAGIKWNAVSGAASYNIYWDTQPGVASHRGNERMGTKLAAIPDTIYVHTCLTNGTTYHYVVTSISADGKESAPLDAEVSATPFDPGCGHGARGGENGCPVSCGDFETNCGGFCVTMNDDRNNCGACGRACEAGVDCVMGVCAGPCPPGGFRTCGSAVCTSLLTDSDNCGDCGHVCPAAQRQCRDGSCYVPCASGLSVCGDFCINLNTDSANCGACGNACPAGSTCSSGTCGGACMPGYTNCGGACVGLDRNSLNCGACGNVCPASSTCVAGVCEPPCPAGLTRCGSSCMDANSDLNNCGTCGRVCTSDFGRPLCVGGACQQTDCVSPYTLCNHQCVGLDVNTLNCGACGNACRPGQRCVSGACR